MGKHALPGSRSRDWDAISYWIVNLSSAFLLSASHNVLYVVLDIRTPVIHFLHNFNTFTLLFFCQLANPRSFGSPINEKLDQKKYAGYLHKCFFVLLPPALLQLLATTLSSRIHSQNQGGSLYLLRLVWMSEISTFNVCLDYLTA